MATTTSRTDLGLGLALVFALVALGAAVWTAVNGYTYALTDVAAIRITSGVAFGVAMLAASLAIVALHVYAE